MENAFGRCCGPVRRTNCGMKERKNYVDPTSEILTAAILVLLMVENSKHLPWLYENAKYSGLTL
jgi:hypothetical protein